MDKEKTGRLIKEARTKKNFTQSELGDLLGVTNKAVSRWENGESFPDVGVLENLSSVLDIRIQDIVTGEIESNSKEAITEVVRLAKLQQRERNRKMFSYTFVLLSLFCCIISGCAGLSSSTMLFANNSEVAYVILMTLTIILSIYGCTSWDERTFLAEKKQSKHLHYISMISLAWCALVTWSFALLIPNGIIPFGMKLSSVGTFINVQLLSFFLINIGILTVELYRNCKNASGIHWGNLVSISAIFLTAFYGDMLHRLSSVDEMYQMLAIRTIIVFLELVVSLLLVNYLERSTLSNRRQCK